MAEESALLLLALTFLVIKHTIADFFLQTPYQFRNKGRYGHPGGLLHAGIHIVFSAPVFLILPVATADMLLILGGEFLVHYHTDWFKERFVRLHEATPQDARFWHAIGIDQLVHLLTYIAMTALLVSTFSPYDFLGTLFR